ncbi:MAG: O-antigen ligase family protein [Phycisphaerae bacterium]|nr:O-antigen ligase family protein [Gemmatimonadaceae bacterium]
MTPGWLSPDTTRVLPVAGVIACSLLIVLITGNPLLSVTFLLGVCLVWVVYRVPMRWSLLALIGVAILGDVTPWDPRTEQMWVSVASVPQYFLLENLNKVSGIGALRFSGMEVTLVLLLALCGLRFLARQSLDRRGRVPIPTPLLCCVLLSFVSVVWLAMLGAVRGGDMRQSLWQFRYVMWLPILVLMMHYALRGVRDGKLLVGVLTATAACKVALAAYFVFRIARPAGIAPAHVTSHADTVLFVVVMATWGAIAIEKPTRLRILMTAMVWGWTIFGIILNNRRTAIVSLVATQALLFLSLSSKARKRLSVAGLALVPLLIPYLWMGRRRSSGIFSPAAQFWSVFYQTDSSSATRDIENFNLIVTLKRSLLFGSGWGHEYIELIHAYDIQAVFAQYRFIAHNSVLWLFSIGGIVGVTLLWMPIVVTVFLAARAQRSARTDAERVTAYAVLAVVLCYLLQAWSDMGVMGWTATSMLAMAIAMSGKLAVESGAWSSSQTLYAAEPRNDQLGEPRTRRT